MAKRKHRKYTKWTAELIEAEGDALIAWFLADKKRFWIKDFAIERNYSCRQRFCDWKNPEHPHYNEYFVDRHELALDIQESRLMHGGISGKFNPKVTWFTLQNSGRRWRSTSYFEHKAKMEGAINLNIVSFADAVKEDASPVVTEKDKVEKDNASA